MPRERIGRASSLFSTSRQVAVAIGVAVAATVLIAQLPSSVASAGGLAGAPPAAGMLAFHAAMAAIGGFWCGYPRGTDISASVSEHHSGYHDNGARAGIWGRTAAPDCANRPNSDRKRLRC